MKLNPSLKPSANCRTLRPGQESGHRRQLGSYVRSFDPVMLESFLQNVCNMLQRRLNTTVTLGEQANGSIGLFVRPWRIVDNVQPRNMAQSGWSGIERHSVVLPGLDVYFLVLAQSGITIEGLSLLEMARRAIYEEPLIIVNGVEGRLFSQQLSIEELTSIFTAAGLQLAPCLCMVCSLPIEAPDSPANSVSQSENT